MPIDELIFFGGVAEPPTISSSATTPFPRLFGVDFSNANAPGVASQCNRTTWAVF